MYLFIHSFIYSVINLFIYLFIHSFIDVFIHSFIHLFIYLFIHSLMYLFIHSFIRSFIDSLIHWCIYWLIDWCISLFSGGLNCELDPHRGRGCSSRSGFIGEIKAVIRGSAHLHRPCFSQMLEWLLRVTYHSHIQTLGSQKQETEQL